VDTTYVVGAVIAGIVLGAISGALTTWVTFRSFMAMDARREEDWKKWRDVVDKRLDRHSAKLEPLGALAETIKNNEERLEHLHFWKNNTVDERFSIQYTNIVMPIERRLDRIERRLFKDE
jgi:hypothetical protein